jgi:hypothetical protein
MVVPTSFGITLQSSGSVPSAFWEMINWGAVERILWMGVLCLIFVAYSWSLIYIVFLNLSFLEILAESRQKSISVEFILPTFLLLNTKYLLTFALNTPFLSFYYSPWFQSFAAFWMLCFFGDSPVSEILCWRFRTHCLFNPHSWCTYEDGTECSETSAHKILGTGE